MRYNAFYGELPLEAFKPIGGRMRLYGGGDPISAVSDAVSNAVSSVGDVGQGAINAVSNLGTQIDQTVRNTLPGGWTTAALLAGGYYYAPEIGAYLNAATGETVPLAQVTDAAVASPVTQGTVTATALPPLADVGTSAAGTVLGNAVTPTVAPTVAPSTTPLSGLGSGTLATPGDVGTQFVTGTPISTIGQGATLSAPTTATGAMGAGLGGAATDAVGNIIPAVAGNAAGTAGAAVASGLTPAADSSFLSSLIPTTPAGQIAAAQGLTGLGSALIGSNAAQNAANAQSQAAQQGIDLQRQMFNTINQQQTPYRTAGYKALSDLGSLGSGTYQMYDAQGNPTTTGTGTGYLTKQFGPADLAAGLAPNYDFMLQQGQMANQRAANVGGGAIGGNALQGLQNYTQNYAGNAYQNAFNNFTNQRTGIYNTLAGIAGIGQTGQNATNTAAQNATNAQTQLGVGSAAAQAAGQIGTATGYGNALAGLGSGLTLSALLAQRGNATTPVA
jgi:hypothetical protein